MITPQLLLELHDPKRIAGFIAGEVLYWIDIPVDIFVRLTELTALSIGVPTWYDLGLHKVAERRIIATTKPEFFITLEEQVRNVQHQAD